MIQFILVLCIVAIIIFIIKSVFSVVKQEFITDYMVSEKHFKTAMYSGDAIRNSILDKYPHSIIKVHSDPYSDHIMLVIDGVKYETKDPCDVRLFNKNIDLATAGCHVDSVPIKLIKIN